MEYTEPQLQEFKEQFARKKRRQWIVAAIVIGIVIALALTQRNADKGASATSQELWFGLFLAAILIAIVFSFRNWRCPACNGYLGRSMSMNFCPKCGVELR